jgi:predicted amidophosphoribosyltransferase
MSEFYAHPNLYRPPVICGSCFAPREREPRDCHICLKPLPLIRHSNQSVCAGECQAENKRRIMARANERRKLKKLKERK